MAKRTTLAYHDSAAIAVHNSYNDSEMTTATATTTSLLDIRYEYPDSSPHIARTALRQAAHQLTERGLVSAAKWALELLIYVPKVTTWDEVKSPRSTAIPFNTGVYSAETPAAVRYGQNRSPANVYPVQSTPAVGPSDTSGIFPSSRVPPSPLHSVGAASNSFARPPLPPVTPFNGLGIDRSTASSSSAHVRFAAATSDESRLDSGTDSNAYGYRAGTEEATDEDAYMLAKSLFDHHQWERCAALLSAQKVVGAKALFLKLYARYLLVERQIEEDYFEASRRQKGKASHRSELVNLLRELIDPHDPFLLYLKGVLFRKLGKRIEAMDCFIRSLEQLPYNWAVWQELCTCLEGGYAELQEIASMLPDSFMTSLFCELFARSAAARLQTDDALQRIDALLTIFPNAPYLLVSRGQTLHLMQDLEASEASYEAARAVDPYRLEGMADYSNSLFVQNKEEKLAHLTHMLAEAGREDAEICCAIGNYHTLRGDNHRAVEVFKRGVRLDPSCASAWILLGHGYIELKDSMAAAEMYRKALELNPRDVRAWTGLGNTYELNSAWSQALHYHKKAAASSPYDFRFWASMANCYEKLDQPTHAIECYKRILALEQHVDAQLAIMDNIARLFEILAGGAEDDEDEDEGIRSSDGQHKGKAAAFARSQALSRACFWHRKIVESIDRTNSEDISVDDDDQDGAEQAQRVKEHVGSFLIAARWEMGLVNVDVDTHSALSYPNQMKQGNLTLAHDYLQRVIMTGTEAVLEAEELLKSLALLQT